MHFGVLRPVGIVSALKALQILWVGGNYSTIITGSAQTVNPPVEQEIQNVLNMVLKPMGSMGRRGSQYCK